MSRATQVARHAVVIAMKDRPLPRGGKGDVQRKLAQVMYATELADAFKVKWDRRLVISSRNAKQ